MLPDHDPQIHRQDGLTSPTTRLVNEIIAAFLALIALLPLHQPILYTSFAATSITYHHPSLPWLNPKAILLLYLSFVYDWLILS